MTSHPPHDDDSLDPRDPTDPLAARLRAALTSEADMVNPSDDGLQKVRSGVDSTRRPWWQHPGALAVAAAAVLGLLVGGGFSLLGGDDDGNVVAGQPSPSASESSDPPSNSATPSESPSPVPIEGDVYVYYVMDDSDSGPRLYREKRPNIGMDPVQAALAVMFNEPAVDPDYSSPWNGTRLLTYSVSGDTATVDLAAPAGLASEVTRLGVQQIVYTVTANDTSVQRVRLLIDGDPRGGDPLERAPMVDVQGQIWLLGPTQDVTVPSPVEITGVGTAFEGTISWEVRREGSDTVVAEGFTQGGANGEFGEFSDTVELEPGTYEIRAFESSAEDGRPLHVDTKTFTVE